MSTNGHPPSWVVVRLGGDVLGRAACWPALATAAGEMLAAGERPLIVCAPLPGLEPATLLARAVVEGHEPLLNEVAGRLRDIAVPLDEQPPEGLQTLLEELGRVLAGAFLLGEAGPRAAARVGMIVSALLVPVVAAFLNRRGVMATAVDPRELLVASGDGGAGVAAGEDRQARGWLAAECGEALTAELEARLRDAEGAVIVAGGVARSPEGARSLSSPEGAPGLAGEPVLLEGGADRAASCLAAQLGALRLEAWGERPGLFTADPAQVPAARLLRTLAYEEAVELLTSGERGFHPRAVGPLRRAGIPLQFRAGDGFRAGGEMVGTLVSATGGGGEPRVKAVMARPGVMLLSLETAGMWQRVGFLAAVFARIAHHALSVDLVSTAEANVTVSFDPGPVAPTPERLERLVADLQPFGRARMLGPCAAVSLVGRQIRSTLHRLGPLLEVFEERPVHLVTQAATDLNLTFVVDEEQAPRLVRELHDLLLRRSGEDAVLGPTWEELREGAAAADEPGADAADGAAARRPGAARRPAPWWRQRRSDLLALVAAEGSPLYVYDRESLLAAAGELATLAAIDRVLYAVKANPFAGVLRTFHGAGLAFECVSPGEIEHVLAELPELPPERILFTPNFAPRGEYAAAFARGVRVTLDNLFPLRQWGEVFAGREVFLRLDPGHGSGHHKKVRTAGSHSKFGIPLAEAAEAAALARAAGARVVGLHAHSGSGILDPTSWRDVAARLAEAAERFPDVEVLDLGGGLGVGELPQDRALDVAALGELLGEVRQAFPHYRLWLEPGRFLVARAGVLLTRVTQTKGKGDSRFVGVDTGMNSLIRPALYGAWHEIVNLTRLDAPLTHTADVVGPICESGDVLGAERQLPDSAEGDVLLIAHAGAYGQAMSSRYNLREPAAEHLLE